MRFPTVILFLVGILTANAPTVAQQPLRLSGRIVAIHDADTYTLQNTAGRSAAAGRPSDAKPYKIRILNVDAPEIGQAYGTIARDSISRYLKNQLAVVTGPDVLHPLETDIYGRTIGVLTTTTGPAKGKRLDSLMLVRGWAWHNPAYGSVRRSGRPDCQGWTVSAQERGVGLWACGWACPPWLYRKFNARQKQINCPCHD